MDMNVSNPLNDIAANLGVTPKVLTQLATGDDREFRELVRGILSILPENEVALVASDPDINPEFLDYLSHLFDSNRKVLLTILQNPSSSKQTKRYVVEKLPEEILTSLLNNAKTPPRILQILTERFHQAEKKSEAPSMQNEEFKIKMKVSKLLNDLEANLGVTIGAFMQIRSREDEQAQEFVREVYNALPENNVLLVSRDVNTSPKILNYLSRLFDSNQKVLLTILHNPAADMATKLFILGQLSDKMLLSLAGSPKTPPDLLQLLGEFCRTSEEVSGALLLNPSTPAETKEALQTSSDSSDQDNAIEQVTEEDLFADIPDPGGVETGDVDAKIALCVDKLYDINADIVTEFIRKARTEILKRLSLIAKANQLILRTIVNHPSLSIEELENVNMDLFATLLKQSPDKIDDKTVIKLIHQAKQKRKNSTNM